MCTCMGRIQRWLSCFRTKPMTLTDRLLNHRQKVISTEIFRSLFHFMQIWRWIVLVAPNVLTLCSTASNAFLGHETRTTVVHANYNRLSVIRTALTVGATHRVLTAYSSLHNFFVWRLHKVNCIIHEFQPRGIYTYSVNRVFTIAGLLCTLVRSSRTLVKKCSVAIINFWILTDFQIRSNSNLKRCFVFLDFYHDMMYVI